MKHINSAGLDVSGCQRMSADVADELFEFMYFTGRMDQPHGGVIFMTRLSQGMEMHMPKVVGES